MIKLRTKAIGLNKPIEVKLTVKRRKLANAYMISALKNDLRQPTKPAADETEEDADRRVTEDVLSGFEAVNDFADETLAFIKDFLGLSDTQIAKIEDGIEESVLYDYANYLFRRSQGTTDAEFDAQGKETTTDPKEP